MPKRNSRGWWGSSSAPWERYPGVSIRLEATWRPRITWTDVVGEARVGRWETTDGRYYYDDAAASKAADFFPMFLEHHKGEFAGRPFDLLAYQEHLVVRPLFGWLRTADGLRRFRKVFLAIPKGNGKSPLGAGIGVFLTFCDAEPGAEVYAAAADRDQAAIVFDTAKYMVDTNPELSARAIRLRRAIEVPQTNSVYRVLSADVKSKHGPNIHGLIFDEFHAQPNRDLYETLYRGTIKRRQPVILMITTAGDDDESICYEEWEYARKVLEDPEIDESYLPIIFEAEKGADWKAPATWEQVNPGLGVTVKRDALEAECRAAKVEPRKLNDFLRFHLNRWVNQATAWIPIDWWDACEVELDHTALAELPVYGGLDLAQKYDLAALALVFPEPLEGPGIEVQVVTETEDAEIVQRSRSLNFRITVLPHFWIPEDTMREHERTDRVPYTLWAERGLVTATPGEVIDYDRIYRDILGLTSTFPRLWGAQVGYDPAFATDLATRLADAGLVMVEIPQNYRHLSEPAHVFEAFVKGRLLRHDGHRVLRWNMENVAIKQDDAGRLRPVKPKRKSKRIDGCVATLMGLSRALVGDAGSVYDDRGLVVV